MKAPRKKNKLHHLIIFLFLVSAVSSAHFSGLCVNQLISKEKKFQSDGIKKQAVIQSTEMLECEFVPEYPSTCIMLV